MKLGDLTIRQMYAICREHKTCDDCPFYDKEYEVCKVNFAHLRQDTLEMEVPE